MTMTETPRSTTASVSQHRGHPTIRRHVQRLVSYAGPANSPSETAIRSIQEKRSTPRW